MRQKTGFSVVENDIKKRVFASENISLYFAGSQVRVGCPARLACTCPQQPVQAAAAAVAGGDLWPAAAGPILRLWSAGAQAVGQALRRF